MNMYSLTSIGRSMERVIEGPGRYALIYCLGGLGGSVCSWLRSPYDSVGASGQSNVRKLQACLAQIILVLQVMHNVSASLLGCPCPSQTRGCLLSLQSPMVELSV